ncbi:hypothetical protein HK405_014264, partial [Cladochytrium tenue]
SASAATASRQRRRAAVKTDRRGLLFMIGSILHLYGGYGTLRALCISLWQVLPGVGARRDANGSVPVVAGMADIATCSVAALKYRGTVETMLLGLSLAILTNVAAVLTISIGALTFNALEGMRYEDAFPFAIQALLGVSYGNLGVTTTGGRVFLFLYFALGSSVLAFFFIGIQDRVLERMAAATAARADDRRRRREAVRRIKLAWPPPLTSARASGGRGAARRPTTEPAVVVDQLRRAAVWLGIAHPTATDRAETAMRAARAAWEDLSRAGSTAAMAAAAGEGGEGSMETRSVEGVAEGDTDARQRRRTSATFSFLSSLGRRSPTVLEVEEGGTLAVLAGLDEDAVRAELVAAEEGEDDGGDRRLSGVPLGPLRSPLVFGAPANAEESDEQAGLSAPLTESSASEEELLLERELERLETWRRFRRLGFVFALT